MKKLYDKIDGKEVYLYSIEGGKLSVDICDFGAGINALRVNDVDVVLGFKSIEEYLKANCCAGATVGRVANRIANGCFELNGKVYDLYKREGGYHIHGGKVGFDKKLFNVVNFSDNSIVLHYLSCDGEENYPGNLDLIVTYKIENNSLLIEFQAVSDKDTLWNPTNHAYFNLDGEGSENCLDNIVRIYADYFTETDEKLVCTGERSRVDNTPLDFREAETIGERINDIFLTVTKGYDNNYILKGEHAAHAESSKTGIKMDVYTDLPCMQFYTSGSMKTCNGKTHEYGKWSAFCFEPQYCPNAINLKGFDKPILKKDEVKKHYIKLAFGN